MTAIPQLNDAQLRAASHASGPLLIIAGAGAGKTKTLTERIVSLIERGVLADHILAITFTNKAAREMLHRIGSRLGRRPPQFPGLSSAFPWVGTFHGLGAFILREFGTKIGIPSTFTIVDEGDALSIVRAALRQLGYDPKAVEPRAVRNAISRAKGDAIDRIEYTSTSAGNTGKIAARVWEIYEQKMREIKGIDFDDLLLMSIRILREHPDARETLQKRWTHIHVDEYQDTNRVQYELVRLLVGPMKDICVVGDSDQTIYTWRGASIEHIMRFEEDFSGATVVLLEENYRSTQTILDAANQVIEKNPHRRPKRLFTQRGVGERISVHEALSEAEEAQFIALRISEIVSRGMDPADIAILYRTNFQSRAIEEALLSREIPYVITGTRFFDRKEVRDALSYIRASLNPSHLPDLERAAGALSRGIGEKTLAIIHAGRAAELKGKTGAAAQEFLRALERIRDAAMSRPCSEAVAEALTISGILTALRSTDDVERIGNLSELVSLAKRYDEIERVEGMHRFLADVALASDQDQADGRHGVRLMTVHAAKGLEFDTVFIAGLEEDLFPQRRANDPHDREREEEERRLFYVALTRAKRKLFLSHAGFRTIFGQRQVAIPSSFLSDIDDHLLMLDVADIPRRASAQRIVFFD